MNDIQHRIITDLLLTGNVGLSVCDTLTYQNTRGKDMGQGERYGVKATLYTFL